MKPKPKSEGFETMNAEEQLEKLMIFTLEKGRLKRYLHEDNLQVP